MTEATQEERPDPFACVVVEAYPDMEVARRIALLLRDAETALGIPLDDGSSAKRTLQERIDAVLAGAMERPAVVDVETYTVLYRLRGQGMALQTGGVVERAVAGSDDDRRLL